MDIIKLKNKIIEYNKIYSDMSEKDATNLQQKNIALHPQSEVILRFINSKYYDSEKFIYYNKIYNDIVVKYNYDTHLASEEWTIKKNVFLDQDMIDITILDKKIREKGVRNLDKNDILPYIDVFLRHLCVETASINSTPPVMYFRHGSSKHFWLYENINNLEYSFNMMKKLDECNKKKNWSEILNNKWDWYSNVISLAWSLFETNLGEYAIELMTPINDTIDLFNKDILLDDKIVNNFFEHHIFGERPFFRIKSSVVWVLSMSHLQVGNTEKFLEILKSLIYCEPYKRDVYYRLHTRHLEAAIRIYDIERNEKNLEKVYSVLEEGLEHQPGENSETIMERCLAMYDFLVKVIDKNV